MEVGRCFARLKEGLQTKFGLLIHSPVSKHQACRYTQETHLTGWFSTLASEGIIITLTASFL